MNFVALFLNLVVFTSSINTDFDWLIGTWEGIENHEQKQSFEVWKKSAPKLIVELVIP